MADREDLSGRTLGEFVVRERIGSGGFGDVYRCEQPLLGRQAVIKVLHQRLRYNDVVLQRFLREAQLASRLDHPYAAHVYAFGIERDDGLFWIAMELVQGTTLAHWLRDRGPLPLDQLVPFFELVAEVVQTAHDRGIVHRDLKPSNVMVIERAGRLLPKLLDFGIAKLLDEAAAAEPLALTPSLLDAAAVSLARTRPSASGDAASASSERPEERTPQSVTTPHSEVSSLHGSGATSRRSGVTPSPAAAAARPVTQTATPTSISPDGGPRRLTRVDAPLGSPPYMSPEQWTDAVTVGPSADLYALGVMAYEALTGRRPFDAASVAGYVELHRNAAVPPLGIGFAPALDRMFQRALAKHPEDRWSSALELASAFRTASGLSDVPAELPRLDEVVSEAWLVHAPQPLAEAVAVLDGARNAHQARDAVEELVRSLVRYLLAIAFATRAQVRDEDGDPELVELVRAMQQRALGDDERVRLLRLLVRPLAGRRGAHPVPELVDLIAPSADDGADGLDGLVALRLAADHAGSDDAMRTRLTRILPDLAHVLLRLAFVLDYVLVVPHHGAAERWVGLRRPQRAVAAHRSHGSGDDHGLVECQLPEQHPMLLDRNGRACVDLWPLLQVQSPSEGAEQELFMLEGRGRHGALLIAAPAGFEHSDAAIWDWIAAYVMLNVEAADHVGPADETPYLGLAAFSTYDASRFVGREREIDAMLNRLRQRPLQIVVGASGVGKSSFVHAGVLAALPTDWRVVTMRPGAAPLSLLASRLATATSTSSQSGSAETDGKSVLVVDQLEELFTLCTDAEERMQFAAQLAQLASSADAPVRVICTIRDDFLMQLEALTPLRPLLSPALVLLGNPSRDTLVRILIEPARRAGYTFSDPNLAQDIVNAVPDRPGALALLSFTASRLWELRDRRFRELTRSAYEAMGGVGGALGQHAEVTYDALTAPEKQVVREIFRNLVTADGTRAVLPLRDLQHRVTAQRSDAAIEKLVAARLLSLAETDGDSNIEIVHEALILAWPRLQQWIRDDVEGARMRDQVRAAARRWRDGGRPRRLLWRDELLADLDRWARRLSPNALDDLESAFVDACRRHAKRKRRWFVGVLGLAMIVVIGGFQIRALQNRVARRVAEARVTQSYAEQGRHALLDGKHAEALLYLATAARNKDHTSNSSFMLARAAEPFLSAVGRLTTPTGRMWSAAFSSNEERVVTTDDGGAQLWDAQTHRMISRLSHDGVTYMAVFTPDDTKVLTAGDDGVVKMWDPSDGRLLHAMAPDNSTKARYWQLAVSPDATLVAAASADGALIHIWDLRTCKLVTELANIKGNLSSIAFSADGQWLAFNRSIDVSVYDTHTWTPVVRLASSHVTSLAFDPTGPRIATASALGDTAIWAIPTGKRIVQLQEIAAHVNHIAYSPNGMFIAVASKDGSERAWEVKSGALKLDQKSHRGNVPWIEFDPTSKLVLSGGADGVVVISDVVLGVPISTFEGARGRVSVAHFDQLGRRAIAASWDGSAWIWNVTSPYHRWSSPPIHADCVDDSSLDGDRRILAVSCRGHGTYVWDTARDTLIARLPGVTKMSDSTFEEPLPAVTIEGDRAAIAINNVVAIYDLISQDLIRTVTHTAPVTAVAFARTGRDMVSGGIDGSLLLTPDGHDSIALPRFSVGIDAVAFTSDRRLLVSGPHGHFSVYDLQRNEIIAALQSPGRIQSFRLSADGLRVITLPSREVQSTAVLWDVAAYRLISPLRGSIGQVFDARFVHGDRDILTATNDGSPRLWDGFTGVLKQRFLDNDQYLINAALSPDGSYVVGGGGDGMLRFWDAVTGRMIWAFRAHRFGLAGIHFEGNDIVTRGFTGEISRWSIPEPPSQDAIDRILRCLPLRFDEESGGLVEQAPCMQPQSFPER